MQPSFSTLCTHSTQIKPFGSSGNATRVTCETSMPQQPSAPNSMRALPGFSSGVNNMVGMIRPMWGCGCGGCGGWYNDIKWYKLKII